MSEAGKARAPFETCGADYHSQLSRGLELSGESKEYFARGRVAHLARWWRQTGRPAPANVIDYGCGLGDVTALLSETFPRAGVIGLEPSRSFVDEARRSYGSERVRFAPLEGFSPPDAPEADLVHLNGVVHHVARGERPRLCAALARCLRPGGVVALFENNPWNPGTHLVMRRIPFDRGIWPIPPARVRRDLAGAGLRILHTSFLFYFPAALRALRPLERRLERVPLGAQYVVFAERPAGASPA